MFTWSGKKRQKRDDDGMDCDFITDTPKPETCKKREKKAVDISELNRKIDLYATEVTKEDQDWLTGLEAQMKKAQACTYCGGVCPSFWKCPMKLSMDTAVSALPRIKKAWGLKKMMTLSLNIGSKNK
jgi:hypothetical protein